MISDLDLLAIVSGYIYTYIILASRDRWEEGGSDIKVQKGVAFRLSGLLW